MRGAAYAQARPSPNGRGEVGRGVSREDPMMQSKSGRVRWKVPSEDAWMNMPDLSAFKTNLVLEASLGLLLGRRGIDQSPERNLWLNLARLADQAVDGYQATRALLKQRGATGSGMVSSAGFRAMGQMEQTIITAHRAARFLEGLVKQGALPSTMAVAGPDFDKLGRVRNAIEHLEERIIHALPDGGPFMLFLRERDVQVVAEQEKQSVTLRYDLLAAILGRLVEAARYLNSLAQP